MKVLTALKESGLPLNEALTLCFFTNSPGTQQVDLANHMEWSAVLASQLTGRCVRKMVLQVKAVKCPVSGRRVNTYAPTAKGTKVAKTLNK